jgi:hypothetical protein
MDICIAKLHIDGKDLFISGKVFLTRPTAAIFLPANNGFTDLALGRKNYQDGVGS